MKSRRVRKVAIGVVVVLAAYGGVRLRSGPREATGQDSPDPAPAVQPADALGAQPAAAAEQQRARQRIAAADWPANPFPTNGASGCQPAGDHARPRAPRGAPALSAIIGGAAPMAIIDGRIVRVGDRLNPETRVAAIDDRTVTLQTPRGKQTLTLPE